MIEYHDISAAFEEGRFDEALAAARSLPLNVTLNPASARDAGLAALRLHRLVDAVSFLQLAVNESANDRKAWLGLATAWYELRQIRQADQAFARVDQLGNLAEPLEARYRNVLDILSGRKRWDAKEIQEAVRSANILGRGPDPTVGIADALQRAPVAFSLGVGRNFETCLTIDDGPSRITTPIILQVLRDTAVKAVFFLVGEGAERHPDLVDQILAEGHSVFNHSYSHIPFTTLSKMEIQDELSKTEDVLSRHRPTPSPYPFRLPGGMGCWDQRVHSDLVSWSRDLFHVHWTIATRDHQTPRHYSDEEEISIEAKARALEVILDRDLPASLTLAHDDYLDNGRLHPVFLKKQYSTLINLAFEVGMNFTKQLPHPTEVTNQSLPVTDAHIPEVISSPAILPSNVLRIITIDSNSIAAVRRKDRFGDLAWDLYLKAIHTTWIDHSLPYAYGLHDGDRFVGSLQAICARRYVSGRDLTVCNLSSWYVVDSHRSASMKLMFAAINDLTGHPITALTPSPDAVQIYQWMKWQTTSTIRYCLTIGDLSGPYALADAGEIFLRLDPENKRIFNDHRLFSFYHILIEKSDLYCYFVYRLRTREGLCVADLLFLSGDPSLLLGGWSVRQDAPLAQCQFLIIESSFVTGLNHNLSEINPEFRRPRMVKNFSSNQSFDFLYSEIPLSESSLG